jgi:hypothetical protein
MKKISPEKLQLLNTGQIESRNLMEFLALDPELILKNNFPDFNYVKPAGSIGIVRKLEHIYAKRNGIYCQVQSLERCIADLLPSAC